MRIGKSTAVYFTSQVGLSVAGFVATFVIARILGAEVLGTYAIAVALIFWLNVPSSAVANAVNKRMSEGRKRGAILSAGFGLNSVLAVVLSLAIVGFGSYVDDYVGAPVSGLLAALVALNVVLLTVTGALDGQKMVASRGILQAGERVLRTLSQIALIFLGWELTGLLVGHIASLAVGIGLGVLLFEVRPSIPSREEVSRLIEYARYSWLGALKTRAFGWMDTIVLAFFVSSTLIGIYEVAWRLASFLALVSLSVQQTLFPELSDLGTGENEERIHHLLNEGLVFTGVFLVPGLVGSVVIGDRVLRIYRPEFAQGVWILVVLVVAQTASAFGSQFVSAINAVDRPDVAFRVNFVFVLGNLVLNVGLVAWFGWYGAAVATTLSAVLSLVLGYYGLSVLIGPPDIPVLEILYQVVAAIVMGLVLVAVVDAIPQGNYLTVGLVVIGAAIYAAILLALSTRVRQKLVSLLPEPARAPLL